MEFETGMLVEHVDYGPGKIKTALGKIAVVDFFGHEIDCPVDELTPKKEYYPAVPPPPQPGNNSRDKKPFRKGFEAVNLGVVPPDPDSLIETSIGGDKILKEVGNALKHAETKGLCKVVFGNYGTGKSHYLHLVKAIALKSAWATSYIEFDPKSVDPANPRLVYKEIMSKIEFPAKEDGSKSEGFLGFVKEIRKNWQCVRDLPHLKTNPWYRFGLETLQFYPHNEEPDYLSACDWLAGQPIPITGPGSIRSLAKGTSVAPSSIPGMPQRLETSEIYTHHIVVVNEICKALGYRGLLVVLDEAEHVRGFSAPRRERANTFFDYLSRCAHPPLNASPPARNQHGYDFSEFWKSGPHFGLFVGLTEGNVFADESLSLRDACVFLHSEEDRVSLRLPNGNEYLNWSLDLLNKFHEFYPEKTEVISAPDARSAIAVALGDAYKRNMDADLAIRNWVKLTCLAPCVILNRRAGSVEEVVSILLKAASELAGEALPWE